MNSVAYEKLVGDLCSRLSHAATSFNDVTVQGGKSNRLKGLSGFRHQIDASIENEKILILIECKFYNRSVSTSGVLVHASRLADIGRARPEKRVIGLLVTSKPVTKGAAVLAQYFNVGTEVVTELGGFAIRLLNDVFISACGDVSVTSTASLTVEKQSPKE